MDYKKKEPMPAVAQEAALMAARWLEDQGPSDMEVEARLSLLRDEARQHMSRHVQDGAMGAPYSDVVCLIDKHRLLGALTASARIKMIQAHWHQVPKVPDTGFETLMRYRDERHPEVVRAYKKQAMFLAELVIGQLENLFVESS